MVERFWADAPRGLLLGAALLALFVLIALFVPTQPLALEQHWADWMSKIQSAALKQIALVLNLLGRGLARALTLAAIGVVLIVARRWWALVAFTVTESLTPLASSVVKGMIDRPRPSGGLVHPAGTSFPSGHAAYAGATCVALVLLFTLPGPGRRRWWALAVLGIAAMAWSRTYLQVHWLLDVVAGSLLGAAIAVLVFAGIQVLTERRLAPGNRGSSGGRI